MVLNVPMGWVQVHPRRYTYKFKSDSGVTTEINITRLKSRQNIVNLWVGVSSYRKRKDRKQLSTFSEGLTRLIRIKERIDEFAEFQDGDVRVIIAGADSRRRRAYRRLERYGYRQERYKGRLVMSKVYVYSKETQMNRIYKSLSRYLSDLYKYDILVVGEESR